MSAPTLIAAAAAVLYDTSDDPTEDVGFALTALLEKHGAAAVVQALTKAAWEAHRFAEENDIDPVTIAQLDDVASHLAMAFGALTRVEVRR